MRALSCSLAFTLTCPWKKKNSYGPETMTWDDGAQDGEYHIVVHVYSSGRSLRGSEVQVLVSLRGASNLITVQPTTQVLESSCDQARCSGNNCCYWWVGTISKAGTSYEFASVNAEISKPSAC
jgi:hypothetical protein